MKLTRIDKMISWLGLPQSKAIQLFYDGLIENDGLTYQYCYDSGLVKITGNNKESTLYIHSDM